LGRGPNPTLQQENHQHTGAPEIGVAKGLKVRLIAMFAHFDDQGITLIAGRHRHQLVMRSKSTRQQRSAN
jgi:hypothetical protein